MLWARRDGDIVENEAIWDIIAFVFVALALEVAKGLAVLIGLPAASSGATRESRIVGVGRQGRADASLTACLGQRGCGVALFQGNGTGVGESGGAGTARVCCI